MSRTTAGAPSASRKSASDSALAVGTATRSRSQLTMWRRMPGGSVDGKLCAPYGGARALSGDRPSRSQRNAPREHHRGVPPRGRRRRRHDRARRAAHARPPRGGDPRRDARPDDGRSGAGLGRHPGRAPPARRGGDAPMQVGTPARVASVVGNDGAAQRSMVNGLAVTGGGPVTLDLAAFGRARPDDTPVELNIVASVVDG